MCVIDTNMIIYHIVGNDPVYSPKCDQLFLALQSGTTTAYGASTAISEASYVLDKGFRIPQADIASTLLDIVSIQAIECDFREPLFEALQFWGSQGPLSFTDYYHLALGKYLETGCVYTFDKKMDRFPGVTRVEP